MIILKLHDFIQAIEFSALAYNDNQPAIPNNILTVIDDFKTSVQCYIRTNGSQLIITFRGTSSIKDWKTDLTAWKKTIPYGNNTSKIRIHAGFLKAYSVPAVRSKIQSLITDDICYIKVYGHSYGAALAILCGVDLEYNFPDKDYEVILFGSPRVGNRAFQKSYNNRVFKTFRIENGNDMVTKLPFAICGYRHVGIKIHIGKRRIFGFYSINGHQLKNYYTNLLTHLLS